MSKSIFKFLLSCALMFLGTSANSRPVITLKQPSLAVDAYLLMEVNSNETIASHEPQKLIEPASLTKLMSMYVINHELANGNLKKTDMVKVSANAWKTIGSRMFLEPDSNVSVEDLIKGIVVQSGNDACVAIAEHLAGSEESFVELMNSYAKALGMKDTNFVNSTGIPHPEQLTTAADLAILSKALIKDFPEHYKQYSLKEFSYNNIKQYNRNRLLWHNALVDGIKTGQTNSAGYCLVASGVKDNMRLVAVVIGADSDNQRLNETNKLLNWGFRFFKTYQLYTPTNVIAEHKVWMGKEPTLKLGVKNPVVVTVGSGQYQMLNPVVVVDKEIIAPIKKGQTVGKLNIKIQDKIIHQQPLIALEENPRAGIWGTCIDYIKLKFKKLFRN